MHQGNNETILQEVIRFLDQLVTGMGENIEFHVGNIYEGDDDLIAGVNWHLGTPSNPKSTNLMPLSSFNSFH